MIASILNGTGNILGKRENTGHQHFLVFPKCFLKDHLLLVHVIQECLVKGYDKIAKELL